MSTPSPRLLLVLAAVLCTGLVNASCPSRQATDAGTEAPAQDEAQAAAPAQLKPSQESSAAPQEDAAEAALAVARRWGTVVVDAGHGGDDEGAIGVSGSEEKDITLAIARQVSRALRSRGFEVVETRVDDRFLALERRTSLANVSGASLLLSIHANSAPSPSAHGIETYYMDLASDEAAMRLAERENRSGQAGQGEQPAVRTGLDALVSELRMGAVAQQSRELAEVLHSGLLAAGAELYGADTVRDRGVRTAPFWVLVDSQIPAVLVEVGYLTHDDEERRLRTRGFQHLVGEALARSIAEFCRRAERVVPVPLGGAQ
jgi:N-acetylmuramoyl-L-alanine amidase